MWRKYLFSIIFIVIISVAFITTIHSCKKVTTPTVTTVGIPEITQINAVSVGYVTDDGGAEVITRGVCWSTTPNPTINSNKTIEGKGIGIFISYLTGLTANTWYYVRAYAFNSEGISYGNEIAFMTSTITTATIMTSEVTSITQTSAVTGGNITSDGGASITARGVCWGWSKNPTINNSKTNDGTGSGIFVSNIIGLPVSYYEDIYYVRAYAINSEGVSYGNEISFTTYPILPPILTTIEVNPIFISTTSAIFQGNVTSEGGSSVFSRGICWNTTGNPNIIDDIYEYASGSGSGDFSVTIKNLKRGTEYYVRGFAANKAWTVIAIYGNQISFTTSEEVSPVIFNPDLIYGTVMDIEGNTYKTIQIGTQTWMAENLKTTRLNDASEIQLVDNNYVWYEGSIPYYCWYDNDRYYKSFYGALYNWYAANTGKLCPVGWHVPTDLDWRTLSTNLGNENVAGGKLKETGTSHWIFPNTGATNESGFTALTSGERQYNGLYKSPGWVGYWWSSEDLPLTPSAYIRRMVYDKDLLYKEYRLKTSGYSIRCIKD